MRPVLRVGGRWAVSWMCIGLALGLTLMLDKIGVGESGSTGPAPAYQAWVPICAAAGAIFGFGLGLVYGVLMVAARPLRTRAGAATWAVRNLPRLSCGFVAAAIIGAWSGPEGAVMFGVLGVVSASISKFDGGQSRL